MSSCSKNILASRYARALRDLAQKGGEREIDAVYTGLEAMRDALGEHLEDWALLPPDVCAEKIWPKLESICKKISVTPLLIKIMGLLLVKGRWVLFPFVVDSYGVLWRARRNIQAVSIETSHILSSEDQKKIDAFLKKNLPGKRFSLSTKICPTLVEGVRIKVGSFLIDNSLSGYFTRLSRVLEQRLNYQY